MKILIDAMGGDNSPDEVIKGCVEAIDLLESEIIMVGDEKIINEKIKEIYGKDKISEISSKITIHNTTEVITMEDSPTEAIKHKKDSSMVVGFHMLKEGKGDVFLSAGNSGALMAGSLLLVGRIKGVDRPAIAPVLPTYNGVGFLLIDAGANTNCRPINLVQFAKMGSVYMNKVMGVKVPKVGLMNIGSEATKGNELSKDAYGKLQEEKSIHFYGNIEGRDIFNGDVQVVVTDGFTGNVTLKTIEGMGGMVNKLLKEELMRTWYTKLLSGLLMPALKKFKKRMDYTEYGGALLLGIDKPIVKCHGSSNAKLFKYTLIQAENFAKNGVVEAIKGIITEEERKNTKVIDN